METECHARLFRIGRHQVLRIPRDFELPSDEVLIRGDGACLIIEPIKRRSRLREVLATLQPIEDEFPEIEDPIAQDDFNFPT